MHIFYEKEWIHLLIVNDKKTILIAGIILILATTACKTAILPVNVENETAPAKKKIIVYQVLLGYLEIKIQIISLGAPLKKME
jgi:hypothetical protein